MRTESADQSNASRGSSVNARYRCAVGLLDPSRAQPQSGHRWRRGRRAARAPSSDQRAQPLLQTADLDVVRLVAIVLQPCGFRWHERNRSTSRSNPMSPAGGSSADSTRRNDSLVIRWCRRLSSKVPVRGRSERSRSRPASAIERRSSLGKALGLGQTHPVLPDHGPAVPGQVGGRLAFTRRCIDVARPTP